MKTWLRTQKVAEAKKRSWDPGVGFLLEELPGIPTYLSTAEEPKDRCSSSKPRGDRGHQDPTDPTTRRIQSLALEETSDLSRFLAFGWICPQPYAASYKQTLGWHKSRKHLFAATTTEPRITVTKLGQKDCIDAHTAPGSLSPNRSNAVEQNMKLKKTPSHTEPFQWVALLQGCWERERRGRQSSALESLKRVSRNVTFHIQWSFGRG